MTAKEYLDQARELDQEINSNIEEIKCLREMTKDIVSPGYDEQHNPNRPTEAPFTRGLERVWELEQRIDDKINKLLDMKIQIFRIIEAVPNTKERSLLCRRYISNETWKDIAAEMNYSLRYIYRLHDKAIDSFATAAKEAGYELS